MYIYCRQNIERRCAYWLTFSVIRYAAAAAGSNCSATSGFFYSLNSLYISP